MILLASKAIFVSTAKQCVGNFSLFFLSFSPFMKTKKIKSCRETRVSLAAKKAPLSSKVRFFSLSLLWTWFSKNNIHRTPSYFFRAIVLSFALKTRWEREKERKDWGRKRRREKEIKKEKEKERERNKEREKEKERERAAKFVSFGERRRRERANYF